MRIVCTTFTVAGLIATAAAGPLLDLNAGSLDSLILRSLDGVQIESFGGSEVVHDFDARAGDDCAGVNLRARSGLNGADIGPKDCSRAMGQNGLNGFYAYTKSIEKVTANTNPATAKVKKINANGPQKETNIYGKRTCDHVMELNILKSILTKGACDAAKQMTEAATYQGTDPTGATVTLQVTEGQKRVLEIREIVMRPKNLVSLQGRIESLKTELTQRFSGEGMSAVGLKNPMDFLAMSDYLLQKTVTWSLETASLLDAAISEKFPGSPTGVQNRWIVYLAYARKKAQERMKQIENEKRGAACSAGPSTTPTKPKRGLYSSVFDTPILDRAIANRGLEDEISRLYGRRVQSGYSAAPLSTLEGSLHRRVVRSPKSGPKSPAGPSCPMKKPAPKKQVAKSKTKTRAPPAKKPRRPVKKPASRKPTKKQVVKRPANRARRAPGKQVPRKRTTPKRKPKAVPKPTRRPKGKARTRRRRR